MVDDTQKRYLDLAEETRQAFADIEYPGDENLVNSLEYDESIEMAEAFRGKNWKDISIETLYGYYLSLPRFTSAAFRYYFPSFLIGGIWNEDDKYLDDMLAYLIPNSGKW